MALSNGRACKIYFFFQIPIKVRGASRSKIIVNNYNTSTQLIQQLPLCLQMRCRSINGSYLLIKWPKQGIPWCRCYPKTEFLICGPWFAIAISTQVQSRSTIIGELLFLSSLRKPRSRQVYCTGKEHQPIQTEGLALTIAIAITQRFAVAFSK